MSGYVKKTQYFLELGTTAQLVAVELDELGFMPVVCREGRLHALLGESRSIKLGRVHAGERRRLALDQEFHSIRSALDNAGLDGRLVGVESEGTGDAETLCLVPYKLKWPFRLFYK